MGATGTAIGTGQANTTAIVNGCNWAGTAARICDDLSLNGYNDWFLPSKDEMEEIMSHSQDIGGLTGINYWVSSEYYTDQAWYCTTTGGGGYTEKSTFMSVRAIRAF
jgi:hypothetical protein